MRDEKPEKKKPARKRKKGPSDTPPPKGSGESAPKKRRGRPPVEKLKPNTPKVEAQLKKLLDIVLNYKDRYIAFCLVLAMPRLDYKFSDGQLDNLDSQHFLEPSMLVVFECLFVDVAQINQRSADKHAFYFKKRN